MAWVAVAVAGSNLIGGMMGADAQRSAANSAADAQTSASQNEIAERQRQFDAVQKLLAPYITGGTRGLSGQQDILGLNGAGAQRGAYDAIASSPAFAALQQQGERGILANASATGGLRGGNTQAALAQFSPALLSQMIDQQYSRLGGLTSLGQNSAVMQGNAGMQTGAGIGGAMQQIGSAQAGAALGAGRSQMMMGNALGSAMGNFTGLGGFGKMGGAQPGGGGYDWTGMPWAF